MDEAELNRNLQEAKQLIRQYQNLQEQQAEVNAANNQPNTSPYNKTINGLGENVQLLQRWLEELREINSRTSGLYAGEKSALDAINRNVSTLHSSNNWDARTGKFTIPKLDFLAVGMAILNTRLKGLRWDCKYGGDPVNMSTGNFIWEKEFLSVQGRFPMSVQLFYNGAGDGEVCLGRCGWTHNFHIYLTEDAGEITICFGDGREETYRKQGDVYRNTFGDVNRSLVKTEGGYRYENPEQTLYFFNNQGHNTRQEDQQGNYLTLSYEDNGNLKQVVNDGGDSFFYHYDFSGRLIKVRDHTGRNIGMSYENGLLVSVTNEQKDKYHFSYNDDRKIIKITNPRGIPSLVNTYDGNERVKEQTFPDSGKMEYEYLDLENEIVLTQQNQNKVRYLHDEKGRSTATIFTDGEERTTYNEQNQRTSYTDKNRNESKFKYDAQGNLIQAVNPLKQITQMAYDEKRNITSVVHCGQELLSNQYDESNNLIETRNGLGFGNKLEYNKHGQPTRVRLADGSIKTLEYNQQGDVVTITDELGVKTRYEYDALHRPIVSIDGNGHRESYEYNHRDNVTTFTNAAGDRQHFTYNEIDKVTEMVDFDGNKIIREYNEIGKASKFIDQNGNETELSYDEMWNVNKVTDPRGASTGYYYNKLNQLAFTTNPEGDSTNFAYDPNGNRTKVSDPLGNETIFTFDPLNRLTQTKEANGAITKIEYDQFGNVCRRVDALSNSTKSEYDFAGQKIKETDALGNETSYTYTPLGKIKTKTEGKGRTTHYDYFPGGLLQKETYPDGTFVVYSYDNNRNVISETDQDGNQTNYAYDCLNRPIRITDPKGGICTASYDKVGNIITITDENKNTTEYRYSPAGELLSVIDPLGVETTYEYDKAGNLSVIKQFEDIQKENEEQRTFRITRYDRDLNGNIIRITDPLGQEEQYAYDELGRPKQKIDKDGFKTKYDYDTAGNLSDVQYADGKAVKYSYNPLRQLLELQDWLGTTTIRRDQFGREEQIVDHRGNTVGYEWDREGLRTKTIYPDGHTADYLYDEHSRLSKLTAGEQTVSYKYDPSGRLTEKSFSNGLKTQYLYDQMHRQTELKHLDSQGVLDHYQYSYDSAGNKTGITKFRRDLPEECGVFSYTYDPLNRLTGVEKDGNLVSRYTFDSFGNRTSMEKGETKTNYTYNALNQMIRQDVAGSLTQTTNEYQYDKRGNLTEIKKNEKSQHTYQFDALNRLAQATSPTGQQAEYHYNGLGFRVGKVDVQNPTEKIDYILDMTREYNNILQQTGGGSHQTFYWDQDVVLKQDGANTHVYLQDELGSPIRLMGQNGQLIDSYGYDEFGVDLYKNHEKSQPFGYTGYIKDPVADTYFAQAREYLPGAGRFTAQDVINGHIAFPYTLHEYSYCWNRPMDLVDLDGNIPHPRIKDIQIPDLSMPSSKGKKVFDGSVDVGYGLGAKVAILEVSAKYYWTFDDTDLNTAKEKISVFAGVNLTKKIQLGIGTESSVDMYGNTEGFKFKGGLNIAKLFHVGNYRNEDGDIVIPVGIGLYFVVGGALNTNINLSELYRRMTEEDMGCGLE